MHEKPKNRDWVKNAAIIFLAVLLVLTFFSNTIMNRSLPEVATQEVTSGSIVARVRGTGTVTANSNTQVKMEKTRVIRSVLVKVGQKVESGDVLFTLGEGSSEDIEAAETTLRNLQASYNRTAATVPQHNYTTEERKLSLLKEQLEEAKTNLAIAESAAKAATPYAEQIAGVEAELEKAVLARDAAKKEYDDAKGTGEDANVKSIMDFVNLNQNDLTFKPMDDYLNANSDLMAFQEIENFQSAIIRILVENEKLDGDLLDDSYTDRNKLDIQTDRVEALIDGTTYVINFYDEDGITLLQSSAEAYGAFPSYKGDSPQKSDDEQYTYTFSGWDPAVKAVDGAADYKAVYQQTAKTAPASEQGPESESKQAIVINTEKVNINVVTPDSVTEEKLTDDSADDGLDATSILSGQTSSQTTDELSKEDKPSAPQTGEKSRTELIEWKEQLEAALALYDKAEGKKYLKEQIVNQKKAAYDAAVAEAEKWSTALQTYMDSGSAESAVYKSKLAAYKTAEDAYLTALESLNSKKLSDQQTDAGYGIDLANTWAEIEQAKRKLADLTGGEEAQILARVSGTIQTIDCSPGDTKQKDDVICTIEAPDMGYSLSFTVTNDQANRLRPGDTATVSNFYWGTEIVATLNSIKVDPKNPQSNKLLTFDLSGNVTAGSELTLSVGQKSANYDVIIPSSSIRTDANGSFVLKVEAKNSPLGNRYTARRVPVEVLASDDSNSAVSADLGFGDYVITTSSAPIKSGELVRLATA